MDDLQGEVEMYGARRGYPKNKDMRKGTYSSKGEVLDWTYYDTLSLLSTVLSTNLFTTGLSGGAVAKTLAQTNMPIGGQLPARQRFTISRIKVMYLAHAGISIANLVYLYTMFKQTTCEFIIENKGAQFEHTLQELLGACTLVPTAATSDSITLIQPRYHGIFPLNIPIVLAENTIFKTRMIHQVAANAALDGDLLQIGLAGVLERNI